MQDVNAGECLAQALDFMFENEPADEDLEDFISTENGIMPNLMDDTEAPSDEHANKLGAGIEVPNTGTLVMRSCGNGAESREA